MKKSKKTFEMNDDYSLDVLEVLGIHPDSVVYAEEPDEPETPDADGPRELSEQVGEVVQGLSGAKVGGQVYLVDVRQLEPYPDQPFQQYPLERLQELADDINRVGILSPILTRRKGNKLQILAGHNRWAAAKLAGLSEVPVMLLDADDDQAILVLTSTNLRQREKLLPSEKAFAYKMQMDALKRQGQRGDTPYNAAAFITQQTGDSRMQIHRYTRLTELIPELLAMLDRGKISMTPAVAVSHLHRDNQHTVLGCMQMYGVSLTIERANTLKKMAEDGGAALLDPLDIQTVMVEAKKKAEPAYIRVRWERIREYLPENLSEDEAEEWLVNAIRDARSKDASAAGFVRGAEYYGKK